MCHFIKLYLLHQKKKMFFPVSDFYTTAIYTELDILTQQGWRMALGAQSGLWMINVVRF